MKNGRFFVGLAGVALVVTYLVWTGISDTMVYYLTPTELLAKVDEDPSFRSVGVKVSGRVVPGTYRQGEGELVHLFQVQDIENEGVSFAVRYEDVLPDTFTDETEVVLEGRFGEDGVFEAKTLLTKCGSRYEATPEELQSHPENVPVGEVAE
jgi:cytochrome c-type biogenesis protein CcmE